MDNKLFFIATRSQEARGGIFTYAAGADCSYEEISFTPLKGVSYLAFSHDRTILYAVHADDGVNKVSAFRTLENGRRLEFADSVETHGESSCHITTDPDGGFLYCANYRSGDFNEFPLKNGLFDGTGRKLDYPGVTGPAKPRQDKAHAHCVVFTPDGRWLCVVDLGYDAVELFPFTPGKGVDASPSFVYRGLPGQGPRHILFAPDGRHAWLLNELGNTVSVLAYSEGRLWYDANISTIPEWFDAFSKASAVRLSPDGRRLIASNRGHDSIVCCNVGRNSELSLLSIVPAGGESPRDVNFLPGGIVASCNENSDTVTFFAYESESGRMEPRSKLENMPGALCVIPGI